MKKIVLIALGVALALAVITSLVWANGGGPISYWPFDEGGGTTAYDAVNGNDATIDGALSQAWWMWSAKVKVNDDPGESYAFEPAIAVDPNGNAYAVWRDLDRGGIWFSHRPAGGSWVVNIRVDDRTGLQFDPAIAVDASGNAYALWMAGPYFGHHDVYFSYRPVDRSWGASIRVNDGDPETAWEGTDIAVDPGGNAYAVWGDLRDNGAGIYFSYKLAGGDWGTNVKVNDDPTAYQGLPAIALDASGNAYAVWMDGRNGDDDIYFSYRPDGGSWGTNVKVNDDLGTTDQSWPDIAVDATGNAYAVWRDSRTPYYHIYFAYRPAGGSWGPNVKVNDDPGTASHMEPAIAVDPNGNAYAVWEDYRNGDCGIYFSYGSWWEPTSFVYLPITMKSY